MRILPAILIALTAFSFAFPFTTEAQERSAMDIYSLKGEEGGVFYDPDKDLAIATNGVIVKYLDVVLTADSATVNVQSGDTVADGRVRIQQGDQLWAGEHITYNFLTRQMASEQFRSGKSPVFAAGEKLQGDGTNEVYRAQNSYVTTDDVADPAVKVRASSITIYPGKSVNARNAVLYVGGVPVFYFPYYSRNIGRRANNFDFVPGYRSRLDRICWAVTAGSWMRKWTGNCISIIA
jgi:LPS-assembly protein